MHQEVPYQSIKGNGGLMNNPKEGDNGLVKSHVEGHNGINEGW